MSRITPHALAAAILLLSAPVLLAAEAKPKKVETFSGKVAGAVDGDTLTLMVGSVLRRVRLYGIDAPQRKQPFGEEMKKGLAKKLLGKVVWVQVMGKDDKGLVLGVVRLDGRCINTEQVRQGCAWHDKKANKSPTLAKAEEEARRKKRGLWADADPMPPWEWRKIEESKRAAKQSGDMGEKPPGAKSGSDANDQKTYWLNTSSSIRHNNTCKYYKKTSRGRLCQSNEGRACKICGG